MRAIGDLATFFMSSRFQNDFSKAMTTSAEAATTGVVSNKVKHLGGATLGFALLERKMTLLQQHQIGVSEASIFAQAQQSVLANMQSKSEDLAQSLALVSQIESASELKTLTSNAAGVFVDTVNALNSDVAGRHLFSGSNTKSQPLLDGETMLESVQLALVGATSAADVSTRIDTWFDAPGGDFETTGYQGSSAGFVRIPLDTESTATFGLRADDQALRDTLKVLAKAALAGAPSLNLSVADQKLLLSEASADHVSANTALIEERSTLGLTQASIANVEKYLDDNLSQLELDRLSLVGADQFEEVSKFEAAQQQLDVFYRIAARQNQTSLAEYLR